LSIFPPESRALASSGEPVTGGSCTGFRPVSREVGMARACRGGDAQGPEAMEPSP